MSKELSLYPLINAALVEKIEYSRLNIQFKYDVEHGKEKLISITDSIQGNEIILYDVDQVWGADKHNLKVYFDLIFNDLSPLFESSGILSNGAELGIAVEWYSRTSRQRGTINLGSVLKEDSSFVMVDNVVEFDRSSVRGSISFEVFFFVKKGQLPLPQEESHKANSNGSILGVFDSFTVILDGQGSDFPLNDYFDSNDPLWKVVTTWTNPLDEYFNDSVTILLNRAHKNYRFISKDSKSFVPMLMDEIILNSMEIIINKVIDSDYWEEISLNKYEEGSVAAAVFYFINTFDLDTSSGETLAYSLRKNIKFE